MNNTTTTPDTFEAIALEAVNDLIAVALTMKISGEADWQPLGLELARLAEGYVERAIAIGGE